MLGSSMSNSQLRTGTRLPVIAVRIFARGLAEQLEELPAMTTAILAKRALGHTVDAPLTEQSLAALRAEERDAYNTHRQD